MAFRPGTFAALFFVLAFPAAAQEAPQALPAELLRPSSGEAPRYPKDYQIGELGRGEAEETAYREALRILANLVQGKEDDVPESLRPALAPLKEMELRTARAGSGRMEEGGASFLVRFLGREEAVAGELYLKRAEPPAEEGEAESAPASSAGWVVDDLVLEERRPLGGGPYGPNAADITPYERFF
jgi:hypothetical protein